MLLLAPLTALANGGPQGGDTTGGLLLIVLGTALLVSEIFAGSGFLAVMGILSLAGGMALLLIPGADVPLAAVLPTALVLAAAAIVVLVKARHSQRLPPQAGDAGMLGEVGRALAPIDEKHGAALVHGERWNAVSSRPIQPDAEVKVRSVRGLTLEVEEVLT